MGIIDGHDETTYGESGESGCCDACHRRVDDLKLVSDGTDSGESDYLCRLCRGDNPNPQPAEHADLDAMQAYCDAATEGPWVTKGPGRVMCGMGHIAESYCLDKYFPNGTQTTNGQFIANARTDFPAVIAELRKARERIGVLLDALSFTTNAIDPAQSEETDDWELTDVRWRTRIDEMHIELREARDKLAGQDKENERLRKEVKSLASADGLPTQAALYVHAIKTIAALREVVCDLALAHADGGFVELDEELAKCLAAKAAKGE